VPAKWFSFYSLKLRTNYLQIGTLGQAEILKYFERFTSIYVRSQGQGCLPDAFRGGFGVECLFSFEVNTPEEQST